LILDKLYKVGIVVLAAGSLAGVIGYFMKESPREMPPVLKELSTEVAEEFAKELPRDRDVNELLLLVLQRGNRDEENEFKETLKRKVKDSGKYKVKNWDDVKKDFEQKELVVELVVYDAEMREGVTEKLKWAVMPASAGPEAASGVVRLKKDTPVLAGESDKADVEARLAGVVV
jgi:hypothetical protein